MSVTLSFRTDESLAAAIESESARLGCTKSDLLVRAAQELLYRLACERDLMAYERKPISEAKTTEWASEQWADDAPGTDWNEVFGE